MSGKQTPGAPELAARPWSYTSARYQLRVHGWQTPGPAGTQRPLLHFLHGNGLASQTYSPFLKHFAESYPLFLQDLQGHGASEKGKPFIGWNAAAELCYEAFCATRSQASAAQAHPAQAVIGMGHSLGAILTILLAAEHPQLFTGLVLLDPVLFPRTYLIAMQLARLSGLSQRLPMAYHAARRRASWPSAEAAWDYLSERGMFKTWSAEAVDAYIAHNLSPDEQGELHLLCAPALEAAIFGSAPHGLWQAVKKLQVPTTIYFGSRTYPWIRGSVARAVRMNPHISFVEVEGGGHCFMLEKPEWAYRTIKDQLAVLA